MIQIEMNRLDRILFRKIENKNKSIIIDFKRFSAFFYKSKNLLTDKSILIDTSIQISLIYLYFCGLKI